MTVYTTPSCPRCDMTKRHLVRRGIAFTETAIGEWDAAAAQFLGLRSAPIVCASIDGVEQVWDGYRPDRIDKLVAA